MRDGRIKPFSFRILRSNGEERIIQAEGEHFDGLHGMQGVLEGTVHDITKRRQEEALMQQRANYDALTQLPNRNLFQDRLQQAWHVAHREHHTLALMFIDLDRFKWVNDNLGHDAGDELLQQVADRLTACVREADTVARLGGDEFTVILPEVVDQQVIERVAQRMLSELATPFVLLGDQEVTISGSIGIALYPQDSDDLDTLLKHADSAMYLAKNGGKNNYQFFQK
jgi:diguanylate cyclase (GGDEF)-like protein